MIYFDPAFITSATSKSRGRHIRPSELHAILDEFRQGERDGVWHWYPLSPLLVAQADAAARNLPLRAGDALHLACAQRQSHIEIYTNDRHMRAAAPCFSLRGVNFSD